MPHLFDISCRFCLSIKFSEIANPYVDGNPFTRAVLVDMYEEFKAIVEHIAVEEPWGPIKWVYVNISDEDEDYPDFTEVEYYFGVQYAADDSEVEPVSKRKGDFCLTEKTLDRIHSEWLYLFSDDYVREKFDFEFVQDDVESPTFFAVNSVFSDSEMYLVVISGVELVIDACPARRIRKSDKPVIEHSEAELEQVSTLLDELNLRHKIQDELKTEVVDGAVGHAKQMIEKKFGLPKGSVQLVLPDGKKARADRMISSLLREWKR
jgi:hypothetical protein